MLIAINISIKKERNEISNLALHIKKKKKSKTMERINKIKSCFFKKKSKIDKPLSKI